MSTFFSHSEINILSWVARTTSTMSFLGSFSLMYMILSDRQRKLAKPNHRLMLGLSIFDCIQSAAYATTTLSIPVDSGYYGAMGNDASCKAQGFFLILGMCVPLYNASLSILYILTIRYRMHTTDISTKVEPYLHATSVLVPLTVAIIAVSRGTIEAGQTVCYVSWGPESVVWIYVGAGIIFLCLLITIYSMAAISYTVLQQQRRMRRYSITTTQNRSRINESKDTIIQALLYASAFILTFIFPISAWLARNEDIFILEVLSKIFYPLQGFWNFIFYIRPGVRETRRAFPDKNIIGVLREVIFHSRGRNIRVLQLGRTRRNRRDIDIDIDVVGTTPSLALPVISSPCAVQGDSLDIIADEDINIIKSESAECTVIPVVCIEGEDESPTNESNRPLNTGQGDFPEIALEEGCNKRSLEIISDEDTNIIQSESMECTVIPVASIE